MPNCEIRRFDDADYPCVVALWTEVFSYAASHNDPRRIIRDKLALQRELFYVAVLDGHVVGTVMGGYDGHRGWIYSLAVRGQFRRRGIGAAFMHNAENELAALGCPKINLQILATNAAVGEFYRRLGYAVEDRVSMGKVMPAGRA